MKSKEQSTVIHSYRTVCTTVEIAPGFGDFLRGSLALSTLAPVFNFELHLDFARHPIGHYIESQDDLPVCDQNTPSEFFNDRVLLLEESLRKLSTDGLPLLLTTHAYPDPKKINLEALERVKRQVRFKPEVIRLAKEVTQLYSGPFAVLHIRLRDFSENNLEDRSDLLAKIESDIANFLAPKYGNNILILSNSEVIKDRLSEACGLSKVNTETIHLGLPSSAVNLVAVRDTLIDFQIMSESSAIYSYSDYSWQSGFSKQCAVIFNIPFIDLRTFSGVAPLQAKSSEARRIWRLISRMLARK